MYLHETAIMALINHDKQKTMNKYKVEVLVTHNEWVLADSEEEAREKAEMRVLDRSVHEQEGILMTGYKVIPVRNDSLGNFTA